MDPLDLVRLRGLVALTRGRPELVVGLVDGPVDFDHPDLTRERLRPLASPPAPHTTARGPALAHGTFIAGILAGRQGSAAPGLCPDCTILVRPIFSDRATADGLLASASADALADAIIECIAAGARIVNLSLAVTRASAREQRALEAALDHAATHQVVVVAATGNDGVLGGSVVTRHPWVIPVVAYGADGRLAASSNLSRTIGSRGIGAPAEGIPSLLAGGARVFGGTSAATAHVTGAVALLASLHPGASGAELRRAIAPLAPHRASLVPPLLDVEAAMHRLGLPPTRTAVPREEQATMEREHQDTHPHSVVTPACSGGCSHGSPPQASAGPPSFVYAIGRIEPRFSRVALEREYAQVVARTSTEGMTDRQVLHAVLSERRNRHLARRMGWVLTVEGLETYLLRPSDPLDLDVLIEAVRPRPRRADVDVVIGTKGPMAPPELCNGLLVPVVEFEQIYSFEIDELLAALPRPEGTDSEQFSATAEELFERVTQLADNAGELDEHRALNYLVVRHPAIYAKCDELHRRSFALSGVEVKPSRLAGARSIVDVVFSFTHRSTDVVEKHFVRVDVTDQLPFLVTKLSPYYDR